MHTVRRNCLKQRVNESFQDGNFIMKSCVQYPVGVFLIRENPACFAAANACPHSECVFHACIARFIIADKAAKQAQICRADAVMIIKVQRCKRRNIYSENRIRIAAAEHERIEGVDAFYYERLIAMKLQHLALFLTLACFEIKQRNFRLAAVKQKRKIPVESRNIQSVDVLKIHFTVCIARNSVAVDIVIIQRQHDRIQSVGAQLGCDPVCGSRFSRRRRSGKHNGFCTAGNNLIRNPRISLFMQSFINPNQLANGSVFNTPVKVNRICNMHKPPPAVALGENRKQFRTVFIFGGNGGIIF